MDIAVIAVTGFVVLMFVGVVIGKSIDKGEEDGIGKDEVKNQKEKA